jgi:hypothetical protein
MSKQHVLDIIHTAQGRAAAIDATAPGFAFNKALSVEGYHASIDAARDEVFQYIALQSRLNAQRCRMLAAGHVLAELSSRMLCAVHSTFGKDSHPYQAAAAVKSSAPRRKPRKRRGAAVAAGTRADKSPAGRSTVREPVEEVQPVAHEGLLGKGLVDVGRDGGASTTPDVDVGDETMAVRRFEVLAPHEIQEVDARPADKAEREAEIEGSEKVAGENVEGSKSEAVAIDAADARRAMADALAVPRSLHEDAVEDGNHAKADRNQGRPDAAEGVEDEAKQRGEEVRDSHGDGDVHPIGGGAESGCGPGQGKRDASGCANEPVFHGTGGAPWRDCGWRAVRRLETRRRATSTVPWSIPKAISGGR